MDKPTLYVETTILSYLAARPSRDIVVQAHQQLTWDWWESQRKNFQLYVSEIVIQEIAEGDHEAAERRKAFVENFPVLQMTEVVRDLAGELAKFLILPQRAQLDAVHLSFAMVFEMDYLLTWNCSHLANGLVIRRLKEFESAASRFVPIIVTPEELMSGGEENEVD